MKSHLKRIGLFSLLSGLSLATGCASHAEDDRERKVFEARFLQRLNDFRSEEQTCGLIVYPAVSAVRLDDELHAAAQSHSEEMAAVFALSHVGQDGSHFGERAERAGYVGCAKGETIAVNRAELADADRVFAQWSQSAGHCQIMMRSAPDEIGLGFAHGASPIDSHAAIYYTMVTGVADCR